MPAPSGALSDESVKKSCAAFFPSNPLVAEELDPVPPYEPNTFFSGIKQPPRVSRVRPKRAYDDISTFLSMSGNVEMIPKAIDDYNEAAEKLYEKKGTGRASASVVQQPLKLPMPPSYMQLMNVVQPRNDEKSSMPPFFEFTSYVFDPLSLLITGGMVASGLMYLASQKRSLVNHMRGEGPTAGRPDPQIEELTMIDHRRGVFETALHNFELNPEPGQYTPLARATLSFVRTFSPLTTIDPSLRDVLNTFDGMVSAHQIMNKMEESTYVGVTETDFGGRYDPSSASMIDFADLNLAYNNAMHSGGERHPSVLGTFDSSFQPNEFPYGMT